MRGDIKVTNYDNILNKYEIWVVHCTAPTTSCGLGTIEQHPADKIKVCEFVPAWYRKVVRPLPQIVVVRLLGGEEGSEDMAVVRKDRPKQGTVCLEAKILKDKGRTQG